MHADPLQDVRTQYLSYILAPRRYASDTLARALEVYDSAATDDERAEPSLAYRLCVAVDKQVCDHALNFIPLLFSE